VLWRSIGVATSKDGITFTKFEGNPILTWFPNENGEEGAVSSGVTLGPDGDFFLYYGANTEESATTVNADIRVAISSDGLIFRDLEKVVDYRDRSVWGSGDELFPVAAIFDDGRWIVYYIPNGRLQEDYLGVVYGDQYNALYTSSMVTNNEQPILVWGTAGLVKIDDETLAITLNNVRAKTIEVRLTSLHAPEIVSLPVESYQFDHFQQASLLLDKEKRTWFLYYRAENHYGVMVAPVGNPDATPPSQPQALAATFENPAYIDLVWEPAVDFDTGVLHYVIYRNSEFLQTVKGTSYQDMDLDGKITVEYQIAAVNLHGIEGPLSTVFKITLPIE
jgi:hypothetical protein